ncbi:hypothetical protein ACFQZI_07565 [Mucilaginibacter lutimaris]|uniref:DUF3300 domain-containing protein n=1 Tax=Mucilaginibacter lutimaris TaxID=931629 RepID=A0ABW2ZES3_9SPHI
MKKLLFGCLAAMFMLAASVTRSKAQVSVNVNIGTWTPPVEYADANYYYLPDVNSYYYAPTRQYIYLNGNNWIWRNSLPPRYNYYNINNGYKVAVYRPNPYRYYSSDRVRYARYRGAGHGIIRDRYYRPRTVVVNRNHYVNLPVRVINRGPGRGPNHNWNRGPGRGPGRDWGHGPSKGPQHGHGPGGPGGHGHGGGHGRH